MAMSVSEIRGGEDGPGHMPGRRRSAGRGNLGSILKKILKATSKINELIGFELFSTGEPVPGWRKARNRAKLAAQPRFHYGAGVCGKGFWVACGNGCNTFGKCRLLGDRRWREWRGRDAQFSDLSGLAIAWTVRVGSLCRRKWAALQPSRRASAARRTLRPGRRRR
jgi:hypothetical protein